LIHFAGTKDKNGVTSQVISVFGIKRENVEQHVNFINEKIKDIEVEFLGVYPGRVNLGDNLGNKFKIVVRDLSEGDVNLAKSRLDELKLDGVLNYFDSQRFGFANNSHKIGKFILQNKSEDAVKEILTSLPPSPSEDLKIFVERVEKEWFFIKTQDVEVIDTLIEICPDKFRDYKQILNHLKKAKNDFPGAFRTLMKKLRTLYINAYQSHIFNMTIKKLREIGSLSEFSKLELINYLTEISEINPVVYEIVDKILAEDEITFEMFNLKSWPELRPKNRVFRETIIKPNNLELLDVGLIDELNEGKFKLTVTFELGSGQYATNVVKQLF